MNPLIISLELLPLQIILTPLAGGLLVLFLGKFPNLREGVTLLTAVLTFILVIEMVMAFQSGAKIELQLLELLPALSIGLALEPLGALFALVASGLWIVNSLYSIGYMRGNKEKHQTQFFIYFTIAISATLGIALSENLLTLFVFYEILTLSTWPLVVHKRNDAARAGGRTYIGILIGTSIGLFFVGILWMWQLAGTLSFTPGGILPAGLSAGVVCALFALFAFGTSKAALMPFHRWLPAAMVAPTPVSALLHAVAVVKAGVFVILKITTYIFGLETLRTTGASEPIFWVAAFSLLAASCIALLKTDLKARLAYSTIGQLSYITLAATLATPLAIIAGATHLLTHAVAKITLFMCAGSIYTATHERDIRKMVGMGWQMPLVFVSFIIGAASITGLPMFAGMWSKLLILQAGTGINNYAVIAILITSSLLNAIYLFPVGIKGFASPVPAPAKISNPPPFLTFAPPVFTALLCIALFFLMEPIFNLLNQIKFVR